MGARRNSGTLDRFPGRQIRLINLRLAIAILGLIQRDVCKRAYRPAKLIAPPPKSVKIIHRCQKLSHGARLGPIPRACFIRESLSSGCPSPHLFNSQSNQHQRPSYVCTGSFLSILASRADVRLWEAIGSLRRARCSKKCWAATIQARSKAA